MPDIVQLGLSLDANKVLRARDKANRAFDSISKSSKRTQASVSALQRGFGRLAGVAAGFVGFAALTRGFRAMIEAVKDGEQSAAKLNSVLKATEFSAGRTARQINRLSQEMADTTLFNDDEIRNTAAILATFRKVQGEVFDEALAAIADMASVLGTDLQSAALQVGKVLQDPVARIGEMSRAGITFTQVQKDMVKAMVETGDIAGAQGIIIRELQMEFGGAAVGANVGLTGSITAAKKAWVDFLESLGRTAEAQGPLGGFFDFMNEFFRARVQTTDPLEDLFIQLDKIDTLIEKRRRGGVSAQEEEEIRRLRERSNELKRQIALITDLRLAGERKAQADAEALREAATLEEEARRKRDAALTVAQQQATEFNNKQRALAAAWQKSWGRAIENTQDSFAQFFKGLLTEGVSSFEDFAKRILDVWIDLSTQIVATQLFRAFLGTALGQGLTAPGVPALKSAEDFVVNAGGTAASVQPGTRGITVQQTFHFNVAAMDGASFAQFADQNKAAIAGAAAAGARDSVAVRRAFQGR